MRKFQTRPVFSGFVWTLLSFLALAIICCSAAKVLLKPASGVTRLRSNNLRKTNLNFSSAHLAHQMYGIPPVIYGTAWKKGRTQEFVELAVRTGFRAIDTACQPKHYQEPGVGKALQALYAASVVRREDLFLQTKFTSVHGQDPNNIPYDKKAPLRSQVLQSFETSCRNLGTSYLDSYVLHSPLETFDQTMEVWHTMESLAQEGKVKHLGVSNIYDVNQLARLYEVALVKPAFVQNRFYQKTGWDKDLREFCRAHSIVYQSFWTLTGNPDIVNSRTLNLLSKKYRKTNAQIWFRFVQSQGITVLTGTTNEEHMRQDLEVSLFDMEPADIEEIALLLQ